MNDVLDLFEEIDQLVDSEKNDKVLYLVDNFRDSRIIPFIVNCIRRAKIDEIDGTWIYACEEYSSDECIEFYDLWIDILLYSNFEAAWSALSLLEDMREYYNRLPRSKVRKSYKKLVEEYKENNTHQELIMDMIFILEEDVLRPGNRVVPR